MTLMKWRNKTNTELITNKLIIDFVYSLQILLKPQFLYEQKLMDD